MGKLSISYISISEIKPYENNPRQNKKAVEIVKNSIKQFGFKNPIILDKNNQIIAGHTRLEASKQLDYKEIPVIWADDLTEQQVKAFRIMDNKSQEFSDWDIEKLQIEFKDLEEYEFDTDLTGFSEEELDFLEQDYEKPEFDELIDKFGGRKKNEENKGNENWFYVEFYKEDEKFNELKELLKDHFAGQSIHEIDNQFFYNAIKEKLEGEK